jgi:hypothetical protein
MYVCGGGEEKRKAGWYMGGGEKKKEMGSKVYVYGGKKWGSGKERRKKNLKGKILNWFYLYVHFVWCKV